MSESRKVVVHDPFNGEKVGEIPFATPKEIVATLSRAESAFKAWRNSRSFERAQLLEHAANQLEAQKEDFLDLLRREAGKPKTYANAELSRAVGTLRWAAAESLRFAGELLRTDTTQTGRAGFGIHTRFPRGPVLGITPFNFPLNLVAHKVAPSIACGSPIVIKPSPYTPLIAQRFARLFESVPGLVQVVMADDSATAELTRAKELKTISFTGSARVGWMIRKQAPEKPTTLELGGNAWVIVMEDTPKELLPAIARRISAAAFGYAGQSCISVQNVAIHAAHKKHFAEALAEATHRTPYGDPVDATVISGPVISKQAGDRVRAQLSQFNFDNRIESAGSVGPVDAVEQARARGTLITPTLIDLVGDNTLTSSALVQEELFAPVMTLSDFASLDQIIHQVNSSRFGLQTGIYTQHLPSIEKAYRELDVGGLVVNDVPTSRYDHQPYGGVKESGQGREGILYAMQDLTDSKFLSLSSSVQL